MTTRNILGAQIAVTGGQLNTSPLLMYSSVDGPHDIVLTVRTFDPTKVSRAFVRVEWGDCTLRNVVEMDADEGVRARFFGTFMRVCAGADGPDDNTVIGALDLSGNSVLTAPTRTLYIDGLRRDAVSEVIVPNFATTIDTVCGEAVRLTFKNATREVLYDVFSPSLSAPISVSAPIPISNDTHSVEVLNTTRGQDVSLVFGLVLP